MSMTWKCEKHLIARLFTRAAVDVCTIYDSRDDINSPSGAWGPQKSLENKETRSRCVDCWHRTIGTAVGIRRKDDIIQSFETHRRQAQRPYLYECFLFKWYPSKGTIPRPTTPGDPPSRENHNILQTAFYGGAFYEQMFDLYTVLLFDADITVTASAFVCMKIRYCKSQNGPFLGS